MTKFKVGDMVNLKSGFLSKYYPTISKHKSYPVLDEKGSNSWKTGERLIRLKGTDGERWYLASNFDRSNLNITVKPKVATEFKVGDRVTFNSEKGWSSGPTDKTGVVRIVDPKKSAEQYYGVEFEGWGLGHYLHTTSYEKSLSRPDGWWCTAKELTLVRATAPVAPVEPRKFKKGDFVTNLNNTGYSTVFSKGKSYMVLGDQTSDMVTTTSDNDKNATSFAHRWRLATMEEIAKSGKSIGVEASTKADHGYIISLVNAAGQYAPATTPKQYYSLKVATEVAISMSEKHGGKFVVLKPVALAVPPKKTGAEVKDITGVLN